MLNFWLVWFLHKTVNFQYLKRTSACKCHSIRFFQELRGVFQLYLVFYCFNTITGVHVLPCANNSKAIAKSRCAWDGPDGAVISVTEGFYDISPHRRDHHRITPSVSRNYMLNSFSRQKIVLCYPLASLQLFPHVESCWWTSNLRYPKNTTSESPRCRISKD